MLLTKKLLFKVTFVPKEVIFKQSVILKKGKKKKKTQFSYHMANKPYDKTVRQKD